MWSTLAFMMSLPRYGIKAAEEMVVLAIRRWWSISLGWAIHGCWEMKMFGVTTATSDPNL